MYHYNTIGLISVVSVFSEAKKLKTSLNNSTIMELKDKSNDACESSVVTDEIHGLTELVTPRGAKGSPVLRGLLTEKQSNCLPTAIQGCNSEDSVLLTETVPGSVATVTLSGDTFRNTVSQHQAQLAQGSYGFKAGTQQNDSNLSSLPVIANNLNVISEDKQKPVSFETVDMVPSLQNPSQCDTISQSDKADILDCLPYAGIDDTSNPVPNLRTSENVTAESKTSSCMREDAGQSDAVPDMATGNQQMYGTPGIGANNSVNNQNLTRFPYTHQNATNNSNHESQLNFDTAILTLKEPKTNNSRQMNNDKEAANQELASETPNQMLHQETSSNQTFGAGNLSLLDMDTDNSLSGFWKDEFEDILNQTIKTRDVQTQTEPYPESMNAMSERWEGQKSQMECLTLLLKRLPNDQKQRVIQALQGDTNESQF